MSLDYTQSDALMTDLTFQGRIKVACLKYADYIKGEPSNTSGHSARLRWAQGVYQSPGGVAIQVQPPTVMDPNVQAQGSAISDQDLQTAVETTVEAFL